MTAQVYIKEWINREFVKSHSTWYFIFGDNTEHRGYGGQAKEMRGEPNSIGIPTKWAPTMNPNDFFYDHQLAGFWPLIETKLNVVKAFLRNNKIVVLPEQGIGSGLSRMPETAPNAFKILQSELACLEEMYGRKLI